MQQRHPQQPLSPSGLMGRRLPIAFVTKPASAPAAKSSLRTMLGGHPAATTPSPRGSFVLERHHDDTSEADDDRDDRGGDDAVLSRARFAASSTGPSDGDDGDVEAVDHSFRAATGAQDVVVVAARENTPDVVVAARENTLKSLLRSWIRGVSFIRVSIFKVANCPFFEFCKIEWSL